MTGSKPGELVESAPQRGKGHGGSTASVAGGEYQICSNAACSGEASAWTAGQTARLAADLYVRVRRSAPPFGQSASAVLTVGGVSSAFTVSSRAKDETPDAVSFTARSNVPPGSEALSDILQLVRHDGVAVSVAGTNSTLRICSDPACGSPSTGWVASAQAPENAYVQLRQVAPSVAGQPQVATLSYVTLTTSFSVTSAQPSATAGWSAVWSALSFAPSGGSTFYPADALQDGNLSTVGTSYGPIGSTNIAELKLPSVSKVSKCTFSFITSSSPRVVQFGLGFYGGTPRSGDNFVPFNMNVQTGLNTYTGSCNFDVDTAKPMLWSPNLTIDLRLTEFRTGY